MLLTTLEVVDLLRIYQSQTNLNSLNAVLESYVLFSNTI